MRTSAQNLLLIASVGVFSASAALAAEPAPNTALETAATTAPSQNVKYKASKDMNFEELLIEGSLKRPDLNVITGETEQGGNGLLRLRENFVDRMTAELGEEAP